MNSAVTEESVVDVVAKTLDVPHERLSMESSRESLPEWDSLGHVMVMLAAERQFGRKIPLQDIERIRSIGDLKRILSGDRG